MKMLPATAFFLVCVLAASAQAPNVLNCNFPLDLVRDCTAGLAAAFTGTNVGSFCNGNCAERYANAYASCGGAAGTQAAQQIQQGCGRNSGNNYCFSYFTSTPQTTSCSQLGCCARAGTLLPAFTCPTTEPVCATPFTLSGDGGNPNGGGSSNNTSAGNGGSPSINSMATMFTSFLLAAVALLFHS